jgi:mannose-6-phosphate isomerase-like protein (cupin superfamily)
VKAKLFLISIGVAFIISSLSITAQGPPPPAPDPPSPVFWSKADIKQIDNRLASQQNPATHNAGARLIPSANAIYRTGPSGSEIHEKQGEIIFVREGEGAIVVGGKMVGGKLDRANEIRGDAVEGGKRYPVAAGDSLYIPANMPHQFFVEPGKHFAITIVKLNPLP